MTLISYSKRIPDLDIYRTANLLVKRHGPDAPIQVAMRADAHSATFVGDWEESSGESRIRSYVRALRPS